VKSRSRPCADRASGRRLDRERSASRYRADGLCCRKCRCLLDLSAYREGDAVQDTVADGDYAAEDLHGSNWYPRVGAEASEQSRGGRLTPSAMRSTVKCAGKRSRRDLSEAVRLGRVARVTSVGIASIGLVRGWCLLAKMTV
jgi:hypothetical protein